MCKAKTVVRTTVNTFAAIGMQRCESGRLTTASIAYQVIDDGQRCRVFRHRTGRYKSSIRSPVRRRRACAMQFVTPYPTRVPLFPALSIPRQGHSKLPPHQNGGRGRHAHRAAPPRSKGHYTIRPRRRRGRRPPLLGPPALRADDAHKPSGSDGSPADGRPLLRRRDRGLPQGLQNVAGYGKLGLPYGGILLADRGQFPELHGDAEYDVPVDRITQGYDALLDKCMNGGDCAGPGLEKEKACSLVVTDEADAQLSCVETRVESRFKDFLEVDGASQKVVAIQNKEGCYFPVLSASRRRRRSSSPASTPITTRRWRATATTASRAASGTRPRARCASTAARRPSRKRRISSRATTGGTRTTRAPRGDRSRRRPRRP